MPDYISRLQEEPPDQDLATNPELIECEDILPISNNNLDLENNVPALLITETVNRDKTVDSDQVNLKSSHKGNKCEEIPNINISSDPPKWDFWLNIKSRKK